MSDKSTNSVDFMEPGSQDSDKKKELSAAGAVRRAIHAHMEIMEENQKRAEEMNATRLVKAVEHFRVFFECNPDSAGLTPDGNRAWFLSDGRKFFYDFNNRVWSLEGTCPECGQKAQSTGTPSLAMLGEYLANFQPEYEHKDVCRKPEPPEPAVQTAEQVFMQSLKDLIHNMIVDELCP